MQSILAEGWFTWISLEGFLNIVEFCLINTANNWMHELAGTGFTLIPCQQVWRV